MKLILQQHPVATDLRFISSAGSNDALVINNMSAAVIKIVTDSIDAFVKKDTIIAKAVIDYDDIVDGFFDQIKEVLIDLFSVPEADGEYAIALLMITKYFKRIGDHAVNIARWVLFSLKGRKRARVHLKK